MTYIQDAAMKSSSVDNNVRFSSQSAFAACYCPSMFSCISVYSTKTPVEGTLPPIPVVRPVQEPSRMKVKGDLVSQLAK
jgi:hypothetical protein